MRLRFYEVDTGRTFEADKLKSGRLLWVDWEGDYFPKCVADQLNEGLSTGKILEVDSEPAPKNTHKL